MFEVIPARGQSPRKAQTFTPSPGRPQTKGVELPQGDPRREPRWENPNRSRENPPFTTQKKRGEEG